VLALDEVTRGEKIVKIAVNAKIAYPSGELRVCFQERLSAIHSQTLRSGLSNSAPNGADGLLFHQLSFAMAKEVA